MRNKVLILLGVSGIAVAACSHNAGNSVLPQQVCYADALQVVSFSRDVLPVFSRSCALSGCHSGARPQGGLSLDSAVAWQNLLKAGTGYVDTLAAANSLLYSQMVSLSDPMPPTGRLDSCTTRLILKWITQKALNN